MPHRTLNLGILAHVDAGKTTLTERLLYAAGAIDEIGSVDAGTTQTDSLALERQRGITIKAAVVSFAIGDLTVNLIDTPGHPDFIAEVERVLSVLDGAVLVISAVEGVQPQTRVLMRALRRLGIPTLLFVNKIDRPGASAGRVLRAIAGRLSPAIIAMESLHDPGSRAAAVSPWAQDDTAAWARLAEALAERDEVILADYVEDRPGLDSGRLHRALAAQSRRGLIYPVFFGSAITGAGVDQLMAALPGLLPAAAGRDDGPVCGRIFKIERGAHGEKIAYVRMFSGAVRTRDRLRFGHTAEAGDDGTGDSPTDAKVTAISVFERGPAAPRPSVRAGQIATLRGLAGIRIGDYVGQPPEGKASPQFAPPALESVVLARCPGDRARLRAALSQLAEADPLINVRQAGQEMSVSLYGEVQKEVIQATLASDFGIEVTFRETTTIYVERPAGPGEAAELIGAPGNPFPATLGLRAGPGRPGSGLSVQLDVGVRSVPMYVYKTVGNFAAMMTQYVTQALREGLFGWQVTDCAVTVNQCGYVSPATTAAHYRKLTPLVLMAALRQAGTVVCEPMVVVILEIPADAAGAVLAAASRLGGAAQPPSRHGDLTVLEIVLPAARAQDLQRMLPGLTGGEGVAETRFGGYRPVSGRPPSRTRSTANPLNRGEYMLQVAGRAAGRPALSDNDLMAVPDPARTLPVVDVAPLVAQEAAARDAAARDAAVHQAAAPRATAVHKAAAHQAAAPRATAVHKAAARDTTAGLVTTARQIEAACREHGFFYVTGHGVAPELLTRLAEASIAFFALPPGDKMEIAMARGGPAWRGYFPVGAELTSGRPDLKEGLYFGAELGDDDVRVRTGLPLHGHNLFPRQVPALRDAVLAYLDAMTSLGQAVLRGVALSLGLDAGYFAGGYTARPTVLFRVFRYPPEPPGDSGWGVGEHTDYGLLTLLAQDARGGLQVRTPGGWIDAPPVEGTFVANIGDMLDRLTGGWYRSTPHRVRNSSERDRLSFPFFFDPDFTAEIPPLPGCAAVSDGGQPRWDGQNLQAFTGTYGDYLLGKVGQVFPQLRRDVLVGEGPGEGRPPRRPRPPGAGAPPRVPR